jgi:hypothetical protein
MIQYRDMTSTCSPCGKPVDPRGEYFVIYGTVLGGPFKAPIKWCKACVHLHYTPRMRAEYRFVHFKDRLVVYSSLQEHSSKETQKPNG